MSFSLPAEWNCGASFLVFFFALIFLRNVCLSHLLDLTTSMPFNSCFSCGEIHPFDKEPQKETHEEWQFWFTLDFLEHKC